MTSLKRTILFYITCPKHLKNISMLRPYLPEVRIEIATDVPELEKSGAALVQSPEQIAEIAPDLIVMFMAYPLARRLMYLRYALFRNIPCIGIEEVHQLALNNGRINHYFTPLDALAVPSETEKALFKRVPVPYADNIAVTGWGFFEKPENPGTEMPGSAVLFLSPLSEIDMVSIETSSVREELLLAAVQVQKNGYSLSIKPHPMEPPHYLESQITSLHLEGITILRDGNITNILLQHELVLNRGNSQICIEALYLNKKILIIPVGQKTIFEGMCNVASGTGNLDQVLEKLESEQYQREMETLRNDLIPYTPEESMRNLAHFILEARLGPDTHARKAIHLYLLSTICNQHKEAKPCLDQLPEEDPLHRSLSSMMHGRFDLKARYKQTFSALKGDPLAQSYLGKIYIDRVLSSAPHRIFQLCDPSWLRFPHDDFVPFFWGESFRSYERFYGEPAWYKSTARKISNKIVNFRARRLPPEMGWVDASFLDGLEPRFLVAPLTYRCPLQCVMCSCPSQAQEIGELTPRELDRCLDTITQGNTKPLGKINLTGGEPFVRNDLLEIVASCVKYGITEFGISSNGFLTEKTVSTFRMLVETFPRASWSIHVSLDGPPPVHNLIRRNDRSFDSAAKTLKELQGLMKHHTFGLGINITISPANVQSVKAFEATLEREYGLTLPVTYTFSVDSDVFINSRSSAIAEQMDSSYTELLRETALWLYRSRSDFFALDVYLMTLGFKRFTPCIFHSGGYFLEPSGKLYKCSLEKNAYISSALTDRGFEADLAERALARIMDRCAFCSNNCGNSMVSRGVQDFLASDFISSRKRVYLARPVLDRKRPGGLDAQGIKYIPYQGQPLSEDEVILCTRNDSRCKGLMERYPDHRVIPLYHSHIH